MGIFNKWLTPEQLNKSVSSPSEVGARKIVVSDHGYDTSQTKEDARELIVDEKLSNNDNKPIGALRIALSPEMRESLMQDRRDIDNSSVEMREAREKKLSEIAELMQSVNNLEEELRANSVASRENIRKILDLGLQVAEFIDNLNFKQRKDAEINYAINNLLNKMLPFYDIIRKES